MLLTFVRFPKAIAPVPTCPPCPALLSARVPLLFPYRSPYAPLLPHSLTSCPLAPPPLPPPSLDSSTHHFAPPPLPGSTTIDLEDRMFHQSWVNLGRDCPQVKGRYPPKPIERRDLWMPTSSTSQVRVLCVLSVHTCVWVPICACARVRALRV
jgi:hypothetical protein